MKLLLVASFLSLFSSCVEGSILYQLVVYADNAPSGALDRVSADALSLLNKFIYKEPGYQALGPGQSIPGRKLHREEESLGEEEDSLGEEEDSLGAEETEVASLRGAARDLQGGNQCPPNCANSGSNYCRSIGCAYCGSSCSRRLQAAVSTAGARSIEDSMNAELVKYCDNKAGCSLIFKILRVKPDGSTTPIV